MSPAPSSTIGEAVPKSNVSSFSGSKDEFEEAGDEFGEMDGL